MSLVVLVVLASASAIQVPNFPPPKATPNSNLTTRNETSQFIDDIKQQADKRLE